MTDTMESLRAEVERLRDLCDENFIDTSVSAPSLAPSMPPDHARHYIMSPYGMASDALKAYVNRPQPGEWATEGHKIGYALSIRIYGNAMESES